MLHKIKKSVKFVSIQIKKPQLAYIRTRTYILDKDTYFCAWRWPEKRTETCKSITNKTINIAMFDGNAFCNTESRHNEINTIKIFRI